MSKSKHLVVDLDETLIFSTFDEPEGSEYLKLHAAGRDFYTQIRPWAQEFIKLVPTKYQCTLWSTGQQEYVEAVAKALGMEHFRLWGRGYCERLDCPTEDGEYYSKPIEVISDNLDEVVLVDNLRSANERYPLNGVDSFTWRGDPEDRQLEFLWIYLSWLAEQPSVRREHTLWPVEAIIIAMNRNGASYGQSYGTFTLF